jgi:heat-inducible transcriptional repressor
MASSVEKGRKTILGLIGPVRMDYEYAISVLQSILGGLSRDEETLDKGGPLNGIKKQG